MENKSQHALKDVQIGVKPKIAALWTAFMFLYIYVDYFHLYMPGMLEDVLANKVFIFEISRTFLFAALVSVSIPTLMIVLSQLLPAKLNRCTNILVALVFIPYTLINLAGEVWPHMVFGAAVEVALLLLIIRYAWKWRRENA